MRRSRISRFAISFAIWLGTGFTFNDLGNSSFSVLGEVLNVVSKGSLFFAYAIHIGTFNQQKQIIREGIGRREH